MAKQEAIQDRNLVPALIIHSGTADTADTVRATGQINGGINVHVVGGTVEGGGGGGTEVQVLGGSIVVTAGTITTGTLAVSNIVGGTITSVGTILGIGGTTLVDLATEIAGEDITNDLLKIAGNLAHDAADSAGGPVKIGGYASAAAPSNVSGDGDRVNAWFLRNGAQAAVITAAGALIGGDAANGLDVDLTRGTVTAVNNIVTGTIAQVTSVSNLAAGTVSAVNNIVTGTLAQVTSVSNLAGGTVKVDPTPIPTMLQHGTLGTAAGSLFGTISAASGAGTKHYVSGVTIVMESGTADVRILFGTAITGGSVIAAGKFPAGGGIAHRFAPPLVSGTNSEITYHFVGAGSAFITTQYWKGV